LLSSVVVEAAESETKDIIVPDIELSEVVVTVDVPKENEVDDPNVVVFDAMVVVVSVSMLDSS
jgi:hypothetical protein